MPGPSFRAISATKLMEAASLAHLVLIYTGLHILENSNCLNISISSPPNYVILTYSESPELALQFDSELPYKEIVSPPYISSIKRFNGGKMCWIFWQAVS